MQEEIRGRSGALTEAVPVVATEIRPDPLTPDAAELVDLAAVLGRPFTLAEAAAVQNESIAALERAMQAAVAANLLDRTGALVGFTRDRLRESVYSAIPEHRRRRLHLRCAHHLVAAHDDLLAAAAHIRAGARPGDESSARFLRRAAARALPHRPEAAGDLILDALGLLRPAQGAWIDTAQECVDVLCRAERYADAVRVADLALDRGADPEVQGRLHLSMAAAMFAMGTVRESVRRLDAAVQLPGLSRPALARLLAARARALSRLGRPKQANGAIGAALEVARESGDRPALLTALHARGELARTSGHHAEAAAAFQELRLAGDEESFVAEEAFELQMLDRYDESAARLEAGRRSGSSDQHAPLLWAQMWHDFNLCRLDDAEFGARRLITVGRELGGHALEMDAFVVFSSVALLRADPAEARRRLGRQEGRPRIDEGLCRPSLRLLHGWIATVEGRSAEAMAVLADELVTAHESRTCWPWWPGWMPLLTHVGLAAGDRRFVSSCLDLAAAGAARNPGVASFEGILLHVQGLSATDPGLLEQAVGVLAGSPRPELATSARADLGRAQLRRGHSREGLGNLSLAWDSYQAMGMYAARNTVQRVMREAGVRRPTWERIEAERPAPGWEALTPAESRVAELISAGHTNRVTAERLGVSANTVGTQLRSVFDKLGVTSRVQLANLRRRPPAPAAH